MSTERKVYKVAELTRLIRGVLEDTFGQVWVEGEISNFRRQASGHCYFTLKDDSAQLRAVFFRGSQRDLKFQLADGLLVRVGGALSVYDARGEYQIVVRQVEAGGKGALQARFEALKEKLRIEGLFEVSRKRPLPMLPQHVGIVTSPTGAAIRDMLNVVARRFPNLHVLIAPARVQGEGAAADIATAIERLNARGGLDVLIVGRGGGSLEDLWPFNEEVVARAIAQSRIPVISAVGHETDFTIADFVADVRAPTPSAAAELLVGRKEDFESELAHTQARLARSLQHQVLAMRNQLLELSGSPILREPAALVRQYAQRVDQMALRVQHAAAGAVDGGRAHLGDLALRGAHRVRLARQRWGQDVRRLDAQLRALSPMAVLARGYSVTTDGANRLVRDVRQLRAGDRLRTRMAAGRIESTVIDVEGGAT